MKIVIISSTCSTEKYKEVCDKRIVKSLDTNQKFFRSIISGFKANGYNDIICVSVLPVSYGTYPDRIIPRQEEAADGVKYVYCKTRNYPVIRNLYSSGQVKKEVKKILKKFCNEEIIFITDGLFCEFGKACDLIRRSKRKVYAIITDIPSYVADTKHSGMKSRMYEIYGRRGDRVINDKYDGYVFLTKYMNELCNKNNKPYIIVEGLLDDSIFPEKQRKEESESLPTVLYAGKYNSEFGVLKLAQSASQLKEDCKIELYGASDDCIDELKKLESENANLTVNGILDLLSLLQKEVDADLLVNPRRGNQTFTKYSFPSKTLEYMNSGTPVLMYRLEGVPSEYDEYLYYVEDYSSNGDIATAIKGVLSLGQDALRSKGASAREFVRENKNNVFQTKKILDFIMDYGK